MQVEKLGPAPATSRKAVEKGAFFVTRPRLVAKAQNSKGVTGLLHRGVINLAYAPLAKCVTLLLLTAHISHQCVGWLAKL